MSSVSFYLFIGKSSYMKHIDEQYSMGNFEISKEVNNIYDVEDSFIRKLLDDTKLLIPPKDFDYNKLEEEN